MGKGVLLLVALIWGSSFPMVSTSVASFPPNYFNALRFDIATACLLVLCVLTKARWSFWTVGIGMLLGLFLFGGYAFQTIGMQWTSATNAAFLVGLTVIWVPLILRTVYGVKISAQVAAAVILAVFALFLINGCQIARPSRGDLFQILGTLFFGLQIVTLSKIPKHLDARVLNLVQMSSIALFSHIAAGGSSVPISSQVIFPLFYTGVLCSAVAFALQIWALKRTDPLSSALILTTEPLFGALFSFFYKKEVQPLFVYIGGIILFLAVILAELKLGKKTAASISKPR